MVEYKELLNSLPVKILKKFIRNYMAHVKIIVSKKTKKELIEHILKHTELKGDKIFNKSFSLDIPKEPEKKKREPKPKKDPKPKKEQEMQNDIVKAVKLGIKAKKQKQGEGRNIENYLDDKDYKSLLKIIDKYKYTQQKMKDRINLRSLLMYIRADDDTLIISGVRGGMLRFQYFNTALDYSKIKKLIPNFIEPAEFIYPIKPKPKKAPKGQHFMPDGTLMKDSEHKPEPKKQEEIKDKFYNSLEIIPSRNKNFILKSFEHIIKQADMLIRAGQSKEEIEKHFDSFKFKPKPKGNNKKAVDNMFAYLHKLYDL